MPQRMRSYMLSALALVLASAHLDAAPLPVRFDRFDQEAGLSQLTVNAIQQDAAGFLWIGTEEGLDQFDGYDFRHARHDRQDKASLANNFVADIEPDPSGALWIATDGGGVVHREPATGAFVPIEAPGLERVRALRLDRHGILWIGGRDGGLASFDPRQRKLTRHRLPSASIFALLEDRRGDLWVGTESGLVRVEASSGKIIPETLPGPRTVLVRSLLQDSYGRIWIGTHHGLVRIDPTTGERRAYLHDAADAHSLPSDTVSALHEDRERRIWIGTTAGLALFDAARDVFDVYRHDAADPHSLPDDHVISLHEDRGGILWIGTKFGGLVRWNPRAWSFGHRLRTRACAQRHGLHRGSLRPPLGRHLRRRHHDRRSHQRARGADRTARRSRDGAAHRARRNDLGRDDARRPRPHRSRATPRQGVHARSGGSSLARCTGRDVAARGFARPALGGDLRRRFVAARSRGWHVHAPSRHGPASPRSRKILPACSGPARTAVGSACSIRRTARYSVFGTTRRTRARSAPTPCTRYTSMFTARCGSARASGGLDRVVGSPRQPRSIRFENLAERDGLPNGTVYGIRPGRSGRSSGSARTTASRAWIPRREPCARSIGATGCKARSSTSARTTRARAGKSSSAAPTATTRSIQRGCASITRRRSSFSLQSPVSKAARSPEPRPSS